MKKFTISTMFNGLLPSRGEKKEQGGTHAQRDWGILLIIFVILNLIVITFSTYLFLQINEGTIFVIEREEVKTTSIFDQAELDNILSFYGEKEEEFERLKTDIGDIPSVR